MADFRGSIFKTSCIYAICFRSRQSENKAYYLRRRVSQKNVSSVISFIQIVKANFARRDFFELVNTYKKVDSGGKYLNNIGYCIENKYDFQMNYKFSIAFENSSTSGYTTEKIIQAFAAKTVPIYWGNPVISEEFNPDSFINCHQYTSFADVLEKIIEVDSNEKLYLKMLKGPIYKNINLPNIPSLARLGEFLDHIFNQDLDKARRRSGNVQETYYEKLRFFVLNSKRFV